MRVFVPYRGTKFLSIKIFAPVLIVCMFSSPTGELSFYLAEKDSKRKVKNSFRPLPGN